MNFSINVDEVKNKAAIQKAFNKKYSKAISLAQFKILKRLENEVLFGGSNIKGFFNTATGRWIKSPEGLGQIGLTSLDQIDQLITGIRQGIQVKTTGRISGKVLEVNVFNLRIIARATPHPARVFGIKSWFVDWIVDQKRVARRGFVPIGVFLAQQSKRARRAYLPRSYQIAGAQGAGFMFPYKFSGSIGTWRVPAGIGGQDITNWLTSIIPGINIIIKQEIKNALQTL